MYISLQFVWYITFSIHEGTDRVKGDREKGEKGGGERREEGREKGERFLPIRPFDNIILNRHS